MRMETMTWNEVENYLIIKNELIIPAGTCEAETSVALYLYPEKVRLDNIVDYDIPIDKFMAYLRHERDDKIENYVGCLGFPSKATKEKGEIIVNRMKDLLLKQYEKFR
jgi:creatinine amidohydrolase